MNEAKSEQAAFRIGGVYRDRGGRTIRLHEEAASCGGPCGYAERLLDSGRWVPFGANFLSTGRDRNDEGDDYCLIPGELTLRDGQWVPVEEAKEEGEGLGISAAPHMTPTVYRLSADPNAAMIARDGPAKPAVVVIPAAPKPPANPAPRGLTLSPDLRATSHLVEPVHGSVALAKHA